MSDLIPLFLMNRRDDAAKLHLALSHFDFEAVKQIAHKWKGICRPYGFLYLETLSLRLERAGEREDFDLAVRIYNEIQIHLLTVRVV